MLQSPVTRTNVKYGQLSHLKLLVLIDVDIAVPK